jgi:hypothetical protein
VTGGRWSAGEDEPLYFRQRPFVSRRHSLLAMAVERCGAGLDPLEADRAEAVVLAVIERLQAVFDGNVVHEEARAAPTELLRRDRWHLLRLARLCRC